MEDGEGGGRVEQHPDETVTAEKEISDVRTSRDVDGILRRYLSYRGK